MKSKHAAVFVFVALFGANLPAGVAPVRGAQWAPGAETALVAPRPPALQQSLDAASAAKGPAPWGTRGS